MTRSEGTSTISAGKGLRLTMSSTRLAVRRPKKMSRSATSSQQPPHLDCTAHLTKRTGNQVRSIQAAGSACYDGCPVVSTRRTGGDLLALQEGFELRVNTANKFLSPTARASMPVRASPAHQWPRSKGARRMRGRARTPSSTALTERDQRDRQRGPAGPMARVSSHGRRLRRCLHGR